MKNKGEPATMAVVRSVQEEKSLGSDAWTYYPGVGGDFEHADLLRGNKVFLDRVEGLRDGRINCIRKNYDVLSEELGEKRLAFEVVDRFGEDVEVVFYIEDAATFFPPELENGYDVFLTKPCDYCMANRHYNTEAKALHHLKVGGVALQFRTPVLESFLPRIGFRKTSHSRKHGKRTYHAIEKVREIPYEEMANFTILGQDVWGLFESGSFNEKQFDWVIQEELGRLEFEDPSLISSYVEATFNSFSREIHANGPERKDLEKKRDYLLEKLACD